MTASASSPITPAVDRPTHTPPISGFVVVLGSAALFGMLGPLSRFAYAQGLEPIAWVAWRALVGLLVLVVVVGWRVRRGGIRLVRPDALPTRARRALLAAAVAGLLLNLAMFFAFERITVALALLGFYTYPGVVALANVMLGRERLDGTRLAALALALAGMVAVVLSQVDPAAGIRLDAVGLGLALGAAAAQTMYVLVSRDGYPQVPTEQAMVVVMLVTLLGASGLAIVTGAADSLLQPLRGPDVLPLLVFAGLFSAAIPSLGFLSGIRSIGGTRAGILMLFEPVVGVALAAWLLGEDLVPAQAIGAAAILAAAALLQRGSRSSEVAPEAAFPSTP